MSSGWKNKISACWRACLLTAPDLWREPAGTLRGPDAVLVIALRPSPLARRFAHACLVLASAYPAELLLRRQWLMGLLLTGLAALAFTLWRRSEPLRSAPLLRLEIGAGELKLLGDSSIETVTLHTASMTLGPWVALVVSRKRGVSAFLLGPDNLPAEELAGLRRRLAA